MDFCSKALSIINDGVNFITANHMRLTEVREGFCAGELTVVPESLNPMGKVHGGCLAALADTVCASVVRSYGRRGVTLDSTVHYLAAARGSRIRCEGRIVRMGRSVAVCSATLLDERGVTVAVGTYTFHLLDQPTV